MVQHRASLGNDGSGLKVAGTAVGFAGDMAAHQVWIRRMDVL